MEIVWVGFEEIGKCLTIDILHENAVVCHGEVSGEVGMFEIVAHFELFPKCLHISWIVGILLLQTFQEVKLAVELQAVGIAGRASGRDVFKSCI